MQEINIIFGVAVLIMSVVVHEVSHGYAASALGDDTAKYAGRLTLNPFKHLDLFGSVIIPFLTFLVGGFIFGWAKPVPYNPYNLKNQKWGPGIVAAAGPMANFLVAAFFGGVVRLALGASAFSVPSSVAAISLSIVFINITLGAFNLVPLPPLDGSKVLFAVLPYRWRAIQTFLEKYGFIILLLFIFFFFRLLFPVITFLTYVFSGAAI